MPPLPMKITPRQYGGVKAKFTKAIDVLESLIKDIEAGAGEVTTAAERETCKKYILQAEEANDKVAELLAQHTEHEASKIEADPEYVDKELKMQCDDHDEKHKKFMEVNNKIQKLVRKYDQDHQRSRRSTSQSPSKTSNPQRFIVSRDDEKTRISDSIKPDKLSHEAKYLEYINWNKNALSYAEINSMNQKTQKVQVSAMYGILDDYLVNYLHVQYPDGKDVPVFAETKRPDSVANASIEPQNDPRRRNRSRNKTKK